MRAQVFILYILECDLNLETYIKIIYQIGKYVIYFEVGFQLITELWLTDISNYTKTNYYLWMREKNLFVVSKIPRIKYTKPYKNKPMKNFKKT